MTHQDHSQQQRTIWELETSLEWLKEKMGIDGVTHKSDFSHFGLHVNVRLKNGKIEQGLFYRNGDRMNVIGFETIPDFKFNWTEFRDHTWESEYKCRETESEKKGEYKVWCCRDHNHCQDDDESCIECSTSKRNTIHKNKN